MSYNRITGAKASQGLRATLAGALLALLLAPGSGHADLMADIAALSTSTDSPLNWPEPPQPRSRSSRGQATIAPLFSSEQGSWPFEPFTHNGLFAVIANYQQQHPRGVHLRGGDVDLATLQRQLGDSRVLRPHKDGYLLSYPVVIGADAGLIVQDTTLYLDIYAGAAIINRGDLTVRDATVTVWQGQRPRARIAQYRPFITGWAGSRTWLDGAVLDRLGYDAHLSRGLTLARSQAQSANLPPARLVARHSRFDNLSSGLELRQGEAWISDSEFHRNRHYGIDASDSRLRVRASEFRDTRLNSSLRVQGDSRLRVTDTLFAGAHKSALESPGFSGELTLLRSVIGHSGSHGLALSANGPARLRLADSVIAGNQLSGVQLQGPIQATLTGNRFRHNRRPALRVDARQPAGEVELLLWRNHIGRSDQAILTGAALARLAMADNQLELATIEHDWLRGYLAPLQSEVAQRLFRHGCPVDIRADEHNRPRFQATGRRGCP